MTAPAIKPGTRCECYGSANGGSHDGGHEHLGMVGEAPVRQSCNKPAVRMVTVRDQKGIFAAMPRLVAMCSPCAEYHEARQKAGAR